MVVVRFENSMWMPLGPMPSFNTPMPGIKPTAPLSDVWRIVIFPNGVLCMRSPGWGSGASSGAVAGFIFFALKPALPTTRA